MKWNLFACYKLIVLLLVNVFTMWGGQCRSGYITYTCLRDSMGHYTHSYHFKVFTYTDPTVGSDRCTEEIAVTNLSSNATDVFYCTRTNTTPGIELENLNPQLAYCSNGYALGEGLVLMYPGTLSCPANYYKGVKLNIYEGDYTFSDTGKYLFGMTDPYFVNDINNLSNSGNVTFAVADTLNIADSLFYNNSFVASNLLFDSVCSGQSFVYNLGLTDVDNDSLSYTLVPVLTGGLISATDYMYAPGYVMPPGMNLDAVTGDLSWSNPPSLYGDFSVDILVREYRHIGSIPIEIANKVISLQFNVICCASGIDKISSNSKSLSVYPNPTASIISIQESGIENIERATVVIQNTLGQVIQQHTYSRSIDVSDLAKGCHFIQLVLPGGQAYKGKFIKE